MTFYDYTAKDIAGKTVRGQLEADNIGDFYAKLREQNLYCVSVEEAAGEAGQSLVIGGAKKINLKDLTVFCRQFSTMINAGLTVIKCLDILYRQAEKKYLKDSFLNLYESIKKGNSFSNALKEQGGTYPQLFISMVESGEASGNLDHVMSEMAEHYEKERKQRGKMTSAMIYPMVLLVVCVAVVVVLLTFVMPSFFSFFDSMDDLPLPTKILLGLSNSITSYWYIWIGLIVGIVVLSIILPRIPSVRLKLDYIKLKMPAVGKLLRIIYTSRFSRSVSSLYGGGVPILDSLKIANNVLGNTYLSQRLESVIDDIRKGVPFSRAITNVAEFPPMFCSMVFIGEESGSLEEILGKTANYYDEESDDAITKLVSLLEPCMIVFMGVVIGFVVISIIVPMFTMYGNIA